jgi:hypothetical protein
MRREAGIWGFPAPSVFNGFSDNWGCGRQRGEGAGRRCDRGSAGASTADGASVPIGGRATWAPLPGHPGAGKQKSRFPPPPICDPDHRPSRGLILRPLTHPRATTPGLVPVGGIHVAVNITVSQAPLHAYPFCYLSISTDPREGPTQGPRNLPTSPSGWRSYCMRSTYRLMFRGVLTCPASLASALPLPAFA